MKKFTVYVLIALGLHVGFVEQAYGMDKKQASRPATANPDGKQSTTLVVSKRGSVADAKLLAAAAKQKQFMSSHLYTHVCRHYLIGQFESALKAQTNQIAREFYEAERAQRAPLTMIYTHDDWLSCMTFFLERDNKKGKKDAQEICKKQMLEKFIAHFKVQVELQEKDTKYLEMYMPREKIQELLGMAQVKLTAFEEDTKYAEEDEGYDDDYYRRKDKDYPNLFHAIKALNALRAKNKSLKYDIAKQQRCCLCCYKETETKDVNYQVTGKTKIDAEVLKVVNREIRILRAKNDVLERELRIIKEERCGGKCHTGCCSCIALCWNDCCCASCSCTEEDKDLDADYRAKNENYDNLDDAVRALNAVRKINKGWKHTIAKLERCSLLCCYRETEDVNIDVKNLAAVNKEITRLKEDNDDRERELILMKKERCCGGQGLCGCMKLLCKDCCSCSCCCKSKRVAPAPTSQGPRQQTMR